MKKGNEWEKDPKLRLVQLCCQALDDKKAENIRILDVSKISSITDYFIIATGTSEPHLKALTAETAKALKSENESVLGQEINTASGWSVLDAHDVMIHLFLPEMRENYQLDALWKDGVALDLAEFVDEPEPVGQQRGH